MSRRTKTSLKAFDYMHCDDFARYLEEMATKGWHFKEWGAGLKFEKGEPARVKYAVEVFAKASENDLRPEPNTQEFAEYCEVAGWKLIDAKQKFCIFKKIDENAVEILTPEERVRNAFKATVGIAHIILLILYWINITIHWNNMNNFFADNIFSVTGYFNIAIWGWVFWVELLKIVYAFVARRKLIKKIRCGESIYIGSNSDGKKKIDYAWAQWLVGFSMFLLMLFMLEDSAMKLYMILVFSVTIVFSLLLAKFRPDSTTNVMIQIIYVFVFFVVIVVTAFTVLSANKAERMSHEEAVKYVPLKISDYRSFDDVIDDVSIYEEKNVLGYKETYFVFGEKESLHYEIYRTEHAWILDRIWNDELEYKYNENRSDCTKEWAAVEAYRNEIGNYYVRYENAVLIFSDYEDLILTEDQISIIREKLDLR